jgi:hypothetical protein
MQPVSAPKNLLSYLFPFILRARAFPGQPIKALTVDQFFPFVGVKGESQAKERRAGGGRFWIRKVRESFWWVRKEKEKRRPTVRSDKRGPLVFEGNPQSVIKILERQFLRGEGGGRRGNWVRARVSGGESAFLG